MIHKTRAYSIAVVQTAEELAEKLTQQTWRKDKIKFGWQVDLRKEEQ